MVAYGRIVLGLISLLLLVSLNSCCIIGLWVGNVVDAKNARIETTTAVLDELQAGQNIVIVLSDHTSCLGIYLGIIRSDVGDDIIMIEVNGNYTEFPFTAVSYVDEVTRKKGMVGRIVGFGVGFAVDLVIISAPTLGSVLY
jgi:hypothetical protein